MKFLSTIVSKVVLTISFMLIFSSSTWAISAEGGKNTNTQKLPKSYFLNRTMDGPSTAQVFGTDKGTGSLSFDDPYDPGETRDNVWAGTFRGVVDGQNANFYCIDILHGIAYYSDDQPHTYTDDGPTPDEITYILNNYYPFVGYPYSGSASSVEKEAAAVQIAVWHYADGVDAGSVNESEVRARAVAIISDADANADSFVPFESLVVVPTSQTIPVGTLGSFLLSTYDTNGDPLSGITISLSATDGSLSTYSIVTDANGNAGPVTIAQGSSLSATVTASADVSVPQGTRYVHSYEPDRYQKLVLATPAGVNREVTTEIFWNESNDCEGEIGDRVWFDYSTEGNANNCNGIQDFGEEGIAGVTVYLKDGSGNILQTTSTNSYGNYFFTVDNVCYTECGDCEGKITQLTLRYDGEETNAQIRVKQKKDNVIVFDDIVQPGGTFTFVGTDKGTLSTEITVYVNNVENTKIHTSCSVPIYPGMVSGDFTVIEGYSKDGGLLCPEDGGGSGSLCFQVEVDESTLPAGYYATISQAGFDREADSDGSPANVCLSETEKIDHSIDFGYCVEEPCEGEIGDKVWYDFSGSGSAYNCNGIQDPGEPGIAGVTLYLKDGSGNLLQTTTTDMFGNYYFTIDDVCDLECGDCDGKVTQLTLRYRKQFGNQARIRVKQKKDDVIVFDDDVMPGGTFTFTGTDKGTLSTEITIYVDGVENTKIHTSCSQPIYPGLISGDFEVVEGYSLNGGLLCPEDGGSGSGNACFVVEVDESTLPTGYYATTSMVGSDRAKDSDGSPANVCLSETVRTDHTIDFGYCADEECFNSIGDFIWHDLNTNGIQDAGEPGIGGVVVELYTGTGSLITTTTTNGNGFYAFADLTSGTYKVKVASSNYLTGGVLASTGPNNMWYASQKNKGGDDTKDSDAGKNESVTVILDCNDNPTIDFGFFKTCVTVTKTGPQGPVAEGDVITFHIEVENCGDATLGGGVTLTDPLLNWTTNFTLAAGAIKTFDKTYTVTEDDCNNGQVTNCINAEGHPKDFYGTYYANVNDEDCWTVPVDCGDCLSLIGDFVWHDLNTNGIQDQDEPGIENVVVELKNLTTSTITTTVTNAVGYYEFDNLPDGNYEVKVPLSNFAAGGALVSTGPNMMWNASPKNKGSNDALDSDANKGDKVSVTLDCQDNPTIDFGFFKSCVTVTKTGPQGPVAEGDVITFHIVVENCGDATLGGGVTLTDELLNWTTNFTLAPGATKSFDKTYTVTENDCNNGQVTNCITAEGHPKDVYTNYYPNVTDEDCWTVPVDCGECLNKIGDFVWHDQNTNGIQDQDEPGIEGVVVELKNLTSGTTTTKTTNAVGYYEFTNLPNGNYEVKVPLSNFASGGALASTGSNMMWNASPKNKGSNDALDSDANKGEKVSVTLDCNDNPTIDFGFFKTCITVTKTGPTEAARPGDVITFHIVVENCGDAKHDGGVSLTDALLDWSTHFDLDPGATKEFYKDYTVTEDDCLGGEVENCVTVEGHPRDVYNTYYPNVTDEDCWTVPVICDCVGEIGDRVWKDYTTDGAETNCDGIQDQGEAGIPGVTVKLIDQATSLVIATTVTNGSGFYLFTEVCDGDYFVVVDVATLPDGLTPTPSKVGSDLTIDSDGSPAEVTLTSSNRTDYTIDFGYCESDCNCDWSCLGDFVWFDANMNGLQDVDESGVPGVAVQLYYGNGSYHSTKVTDNTGSYLFPTLIPGDYYVKFVLPNGYTFTSPNAGNDELDSDANTASGQTHTVTLLPGLCDLSLDAGVYTVQRPDLKLEKTVNNDHPMQGETVTFTITVTNESSVDATGVVVKDYLPEELTYASYSVSKGTFDDSILEWTIGNVTAGSSETLTITAVVDWGSQTNFEEFDLGIASGFNLFILRNLDQPSSDTQGKVAVGCNATLEHYSVGDQLNGYSGDVLIVGKTLIYKSGAVYNGNVVYGTSTNLPQSAVSIDGDLRQDNPIDFAAAAIELNNLSAQLSTYTVNGATSFQWGGLTLTGDDPYLNVFYVDGDDLSAANNVQIDVPNGSVVLVNIDGEIINWSGGLSVSGTSITNVLYNFYEAQYMTIQGIDIRGSILAPQASVDFVSGVQNGQMIAKCLVGRGQFNHVYFLGNIPEVPNLINVAEIIAMDQIDVDSTPGNGVSSEDDYDTATLFGEGTVDPGQGSDSNGEWEQVGNFLSGEIVYALTNDNNGNMLAGTWGGKIYRSSDGVTWTRINSNMFVGFIWNIAVNTQGHIYVGTEQGVFRSTDNGSSWIPVGLIGFDVRAIAINSDGHVFAGTWGLGVYKSTDNGLNWTALNSGLTNLAINALVVNSSGHLFAATFGSGIAKSTDGGASWSSLSVGYEFIWSLAITSDDILYAGSYGDGLYRSSNGGASWTKVQAGVNAQYIYALTVDANDIVYASSWTSGIFVADDASGSSFNSMGMGGLGVSTIYAPSFSNAIYVGTKDGTIYKKVDASVTSTDEPEELPTEFALEQNYPNPFNPTTTIKFSIPEAGIYKLKVFNVLGQEVTTLINGELSVGVHSIVLNAETYSSGVYFYQLSGKNVSQVKKMVLMK